MRHVTLQTMTVTTRDDLALRYVVNTPTSRPDTEPMPLVIIMHGRGADAYDLADIAPMIDGPRGYRFVFPNAPNAWEAAPGMMFGFTWFDGVPAELKSLQASRRIMMDFLDEVVKRFPTPAGKVVLGGFSQGGLMALDTGLRTTQPLAGIVVMSGALHEHDLPDLTTRKDQRVLIIHGTEDEMINVNMARRARRVLEQHGLEVEYHEFPMGHHVTPESMLVVRDFIEKCLG
ncbi:MAG TPA: alpha/beta hydrolase [Thermoanaerobaculia bacterium]|nr:alpha/beta hydrolase [Thermoanaerobaculia bacterium]